MMKLIITVSGDNAEMAGEALADAVEAIETSEAGGYRGWVYRAWVEPVGTIARDEDPPVMRIVK